METCTETDTQSGELPEALAEVKSLLAEGRAIPYLGPGALSLSPDYAVPGTPEALVQKLVAKVSVPHKIRNRLTQAAQFIENFKHRKTLVDLMNGAFDSPALPAQLHRQLAGMGLPLIVDSWYDDAMRAALVQAGAEFAEVQGLSQSEHFGTWTGWYGPDGASLPDPLATRTLLYKPIGAHAPAANYLVSDSDYVEVLTEIDIQTPIPQEVQRLRSGRAFVFLGCRFNDQLTRSFARQIMKRSGDRHWAVLPETPTRMELKFLEEQRITRIAMPLEHFAAGLAADAATV